MGLHAVTLQIDQQIHDRLAAEADLLSTTPSAVAEEAIRAYLDQQDGEREFLRERMAEADQGKFVSSEAMFAWMRSWGSENELPVPKADLDFGPRNRA